MARAAAKKNRTPKPPAGRQPKPSRAVRKANRPVEETLFFQRMRRGTKWVFALLALVFAFSFVVAGVGSGSTGVGSVFDALGNLFGRNSSSSSLSVSKALKRTQKNPKDAAAFLALGRAYKAKNQDFAAISAYESYAKLRPKDTTGLSELLGLYENQASLYGQAAQQALASQPPTPTQSFGPSSSSKLGQALSDPIQQATSSSASDSSTAASQQYQQFASLAAQANQNVENTFRRLVVADPADPNFLLQYARASQSLGNTTAAVKSYRTFVKKFSDDPNLAYARQQLKSLTAKPKPATKPKAKTKSKASSSG